jgi:hypothetical protein
MKILVLSLLLVPSLVSAGDLPGRFSGEVTVEYRYFPTDGEYGNLEKHHPSLVIQPEYSRSWDNDRSVISTILFARLDQVDDRRSHLDIRELSYVTSWSHMELRLGISKVFWGVTESQHLVDVINQTDLVENPDGEQKLGQPMINPTLVTPAGNFELFVLPYFRERTFPGKDGRYRGALVVDTDNAEFTDEDKKKHIDYALRWTSYWQDLEWGLSWFRGTDRDPFFRVDTVRNVLVPVYGQSQQLGLELQYLYKDLLVKTELLRKESSFYDPYTAATIGFEYTFTNVAGGMDVGILYEWLYDSRDELTPSGFADSSFFGTRLALNNEASTDMLVGAIFDNHTFAMSVFRVEASHRLSQSLSLGLEVNVIGNPPDNSVLAQFQSDDYIQFTLSGYY